MARLKSQLAQKLEKALAREFPPPATVKLDEHDGIIGVVTSDEFAGIDQIDNSPASDRPDCRGQFESRRTSAGASHRRGNTG